MIDRDRALLNAMEIVLPIVQSRICMWHMNKDVHAWIRQRFGVVKASCLMKRTGGHIKNLESSTLEGFMTGCKSVEPMVRRYIKMSFQVYSSSLSGFK